MIKRLLLGLALLFGAGDPSWAQFGLPSLFGYQTVACTSATLAKDSEESSNVAHHSSTLGPATTPTTWSFTNTAGTELFVAVDVTDAAGFQTGVTGLAVTYNSVAMTQSASFANWNGNNDSLYIFSLASPATGSHTVSISWSGGAAYDVLGAAISFVGVNSAMPLINVQTAKDLTGGSTAAAVSMPSTSSGDFVLSVVGTGTGVGAATSPTVTSAILNESVATGSDNIALGRQSTTGGTVSAGWAVTADWWAVLGAEVQKATGSGCGTVSTATAYSMTGPTSGTVGVTTGNFTVTSNGKLTSAVTVTPNDSGNGGSFSPGTASLIAGNFTSGQFAYTPATAGTYNICATNSSTLINPNCISFTASATSGPSFFVATTGADSNPGTINLPFLTLAKCQSAMEAQPSTGTKTCTVRGGTYGSFPTLTLTSADNGETWQFSSTDGVDSAILDGGATSGSNGTNWGIVINGGSNIIINGFTLQNFTFGGLVVHGGASFEGQFPAVGTADSNTLKNNKVLNIFSASASCNIFCGNAGGIYVQGQATNTKIFNNVHQTNTGMGIKISANADGNTPNDNTSGTDIENNVVLNVENTQSDSGAIYMQDTTERSTGMIIKNNFVRDWAAGGKGIYLDDGQSNATVSGNIIGPPTASASQSGWASIFLHGGNSVTFSGNIIDLGATGNVLALSEGGTGIGGNPQQANTFFQQNIVVGTGGYNTGGPFLNVQGTAPGGTTVENTAASNNDWTNPNGGSLSSGGPSFSDSSPQTYTSTQLKCTTHLYAIGAGSSALGAPINFPPIVGGWGPPGYSIPISTTASSSCGNT